MFAVYLTRFRQFWVIKCFDHESDDQGLENCQVFFVCLLLLLFTVLRFLLLLGLAHNCLQTLHIIQIVPLFSVYFVYN